jgi:hypothetical protein
MTGRCGKLHFVGWMAMVGLLGAGDLRAQGPVEYPGRTPGEAKASVQDGKIVLGNGAIECSWTVANGHLRPVWVKNLSSPSLVQPKGECFQLLLDDGQTLKASGLKVVSGPDVDNLRPNAEARRLAAQMGGKRVHATLATPDDNLTIRWRVELRDGSNYVRQYVSLTNDRRNASV